MRFAPEARCNSFLAAPSTPQGQAAATSSASPDTMAASQPDTITALLSLFTKQLEDQRKQHEKDEERREEERAQREKEREQERETDKYERRRRSSSFLRCLRWSSSCLVKRLNNAVIRVWPARGHGVRASTAGCSVTLRIGGACLKSGLLFGTLAGGRCHCQDFRYEHGTREVSILQTDWVRVRTKNRFVVPLSFRHN